MPRCPFVGGEQISFHIGVGSDRYSVASLLVGNGAEGSLNSVESSTPREAVGVVAQFEDVKGFACSLSYVGDFHAVLTKSRDLPSIHQHTSTNRFRYLNRLAQGYWLDILNPARFKGLRQTRHREPVWSPS